MAPHARTIRRVEPHQQLVGRNGNDDGAQAVNALFLEPMMGTPLAIYVEKDVEDRDVVVDLITKYGGTVSPGYSGVPYILVNPFKESGQSLFRQYAGKKGKIVLHSRWVNECISRGELQTFHTNWAECKVTGNERIVPVNQPIVTENNVNNVNNVNNRIQMTQAQPRPPPAQQMAQTMQVPQHVQQAPQAPHPMASMAPQLPPGAAAYYPVYANAPHQGPPRQPMQPQAAPPQTWQTANGLAAQQAHMAHMQHPQMIPRPHGVYDRDPNQWSDQFNMAVQHPSMPALPEPVAPGYYDPRFRDDQGWGANPQEYYEQPTFDQTYQTAENYLQQQPPPPPQQEEMNSIVPAPAPERPRGRKRNRSQTNTAPTAASLVNRPQALARSPTPPTRVIKSTYGGNLFTADDVVYLKKYIDYCQEQGLVLSLREICERIAVKAPHHTFYSWRRYCNKHQIRLGGYAMDVDGSRSPSLPRDENEEDLMEAGPGPGTVAAAQRFLHEAGPRTRSPTPPRALYRSTTGKGVAFTEEDVAFLVKFLAYRRDQGRLDMVTFWKDVAMKAPHHSRASWMKYYRRHKHELNFTDGDEPLPPAPPKKMRYGKNDDILLAKYFVNKPEGTSDKVFQSFARIHPHHPWKGWQEHHRIHKAKIDYLIQKLQNGEQLQLGDDE